MTLNQRAKAAKAAKGVLLPRPAPPRALRPLMTGPRPIRRACREPRCHGTAMVSCSSETVNSTDCEICEDKRLDYDSDGLYNRFSMSSRESMATNHCEPSSADSKAHLRIGPTRSPPSPWVPGWYSKCHRRTQLTTDTATNQGYQG